MKFYYHVLKMSEILAGTPEGNERVEMAWTPMPTGMVSPPRVGETMTLGGIDEEGVKLLKVVSVHWEVSPKVARCLISVTEEDNAMVEQSEKTREEILAEFNKSPGLTAK